MSQTLRRGAVRRPPPQKKQKASVIDRILATLPFGHATLRRIATWSIVGGALAGALALAAWFGVPGAIGVAVAEGIGRAGFRVTNVEITGLDRMNQDAVYAAAFDQRSLAMPLVDLQAVRRKLLAYGWVADAHVSRRLPDTLLIDIVERTPSAIWQDRRQLRLIADDGTLLDTVSPDDMPDLPLMIGPGAYRQEASYQHLLGAAPALRPMVHAATWIGNRRWNLTFQSGETLFLPAGDDDAAKALVRFAALEGASPLLGKGWVRFDMRFPGQLIARKPGQAAPSTIATPPTGTADASSPARAEKPVTEKEV